MKALSLWQPWASAIAAGLKKVETRHWATKYRGPLAIAATKHTPKDYADFFDGLDNHAAAAFAQIGIGTQADLPRSAIVCTCVLVDCVEMTHEMIDSTPGMELEWGIWQVGRYAWRLENVVRLEPPAPVACCGRTLFNWERCEGCGGTATKRDVDGVPLCAACAKAL